MMKAVDGEIVVPLSRFWRLLQTEDSWVTDLGTGFQTIHYIGFFTSTDALSGNVSDFASASASSAFSGSFTANQAQALVGRWASLANEPNFSWWAVDLGAGNEEVIHSVVIDPYNPASYHAKEMDLQYSSDGVNWLTSATIFPADTPVQITFTDL